MKVALVTNTDWSLFNFRLPLAVALRDAGLEVVMVSVPGPFTHHLKHAGFKHIPWNIDRTGLNPVSEMRALLDLVRIYRAERPDAVQHFTIKPVFHGSLAAAWAGVPRVVNTFTGVGFPYLDKLDSRVFRPFLTPVLRRLLGQPGAHTIFYNSHDRDMLLRRGVVRPNKSSVIPGSGVDMRKFPANTGGAPPDRPITVVMAARLLWDKGVQQYVDAARALTGGDPTYRFILAGEGDVGSRLCVPRETLDAWHSEGVVELLGHVENMPELLSGADIAVLPSHHEGLPRFLLEAASTGLPIVTTDDPGCRCVVEDGVNGLVVPISDVPALAEAISTLAADAGMRRRMGHAGREKAVAEFGLEAILVAHMRLYEHLGISAASSSASKTRTVSA